MTTGPPAKRAAPTRDVGHAIVAVEVNVSCPNVEDRSRMFAHSAAATAEVMLAATGCGLPRWAKLSPNVPNIVEIAGAALQAGAEGLTLTNTLLGLALHPETGPPILGAGGGGLSGQVVHPVAVRAVWECRAAYPDAAIIGVGGVASARDAVEFLHGRGRCRAGGHGHLPRSAGTVEGAARARVAGAAAGAPPSARLRSEARQQTKGRVMSADASTG